MILLIIFCFAIFSNMVANAWGNAIDRTIEKHVKHNGNDLTVLFTYAISITIIILFFLLFFHSYISNIKDVSKLDIGTLLTS
jgi:hypothetical protein